MKHHQRNPNFQFIQEPIEFNKNSDRHFLQYCLGATLYMPGTKDIGDKILRKEMPELTSMVMCCEDAIREEELSEAESNVIQHLDRMARAIDAGEITHDNIPLTFVRVRSTEQFRSFSTMLSSNQAEVLSGFVFPKFCSTNGHDYFRCLESLNKELRVSLYGMPILEGRTIALKEARESELNITKNLLTAYKDIVLNVRVGATDFSSIFGVRRGINYSIYDILTVRDCLSDILNYFARDQDECVISAPVWEYFSADKNENIDRFLHGDIHQSLLQRSPIINEAIDGLLREVILDKANGFVGKTIIHPSHAKYVNSMQAVTREEFEDAKQILDTSGGVIKSAKSNKMNEINPHRTWAEKISQRAAAYGVIEDQGSYLQLILGEDCEAETPIQPAILNRTPN